MSRGRRTEPVLILQKGKWMTCENGHPIAKARRDIHSEEVLEPSDFDWAIDVPEDNSDVEPCPKCGADYIRESGWTGLMPHTEEGWKE
jgi:hypothetical protein